MWHAMGGAEHIADAWLAPIGTPLASGPIDSQEPIWQSSRAVRSPGSALTRGSPRQSSAKPCSACASA